MSAPLNRPDGWELLTVRYQAVLDHLRAQDDALSAQFAQLESWAVTLSDQISRIDRLAERLARLEALVESWDVPLPAEDRLEEVARDAEAARDEVCKLTDLVALLLARSGVPVPAGLTLEEIHDFVRRNP